NGYTDNVPIGPGLKSQGITSNQELSQKRADTVMQYLIAQGVNPNLVSAQGFGEADPVASNHTPERRAPNRRGDAVMQYLIAQGVNPNLVSAQGFGEADPVASNDTPEGRAQNRRVELTLAGAGQ